MNIPENRMLKQFQYGAHWSDPGRGQSGYYIKLPGESWVRARQTPASDELPSNFRQAYREAKREEQYETV